MRLLPDTSVWVEYLRGRDTEVVAVLEEHLERNSVLVCGPVIGELLAGTVPDQREDLWLGVGSLPWASLERPGWRRVGEVAGDLRRGGIVVPLTDVQIAVAAVDADAELWTHDRDFQKFEGVRMRDPFA